jgi:hypothetical protein
MSLSTNVSVFAHRWPRPAFAALCALPLLLGSSSCASSGSGAQGDDAGSDDAAGQPDVSLDTSPDRSDSTTPLHDSGSSSGADSSVVQDGSSNPDSAGTDGDVAEGSADAPAGVAESGAQDVVVSDAPCGGCGPRALCYQGLCIGSQRVFVSSTVYTGDLGGSPGADSTCGTLASQAGLGGTWMAWVADGTHPPPSQRFYMSKGPYRTLNGAVVALNFPALASGNLFNAIDIDETGASQASSSAVKTWTGTTATGDAASQTCGGFTAGDASSIQGEVGNLGNASGNWDADGAENCTKQQHIYCFEQ